MEKKISDEQLEQLLNDQYFKEADLMEEALFSDEEDNATDHMEEEEDAEAVQKSYEQLIQRLKADGVYREEDTQEEDSSNIIFIDKVGKGKERGIGKTHKLARAAGFVIVCVLGVFAASMTSEANRKYFVERIRYLEGDDTRIMVDNSLENELPDQDEALARKEIEEKLGVELPELMYRPETFEFNYYMVDSNANLAALEFLYNGNTLYLNVEEKNSRQASSSFAIRGQRDEIIYLENENLYVTITEIEDSKDGKSIYSAQWEKDGVSFEFIGQINKDILKKIIKKIRY